MIRPKGLRTWIEVDRKAIANNYRIFRSLIRKGCELMAVVKSNAYGHSLVDFSKEVESLGVDWLGVDSAVEALALREAGLKKSILILGYTLPEMIKEVAEKDISMAISSFDQLKKISKIKTSKSKKIHIKVDTGMCRQGFLEKDILKLLSFYKLQATNYKLEFEGLFTHFSMAKNPSFPQFTNLQLKSFKKWIEAFHKVRINPIVHAGATGGAILYPESHFDMVRIGIGFYGLWPSKETESYAKDKIKLTPALSWKTIISEIKKITKGSKIGYDCTEILNRDSITAICPIGYWHGLPRALSSIGRVLVGGKEVRILGRVSMDMIILDITDISNVKIEDEVVLIGNQGKGKISVEDISTVIDMSEYELITRLNPLIKRIYK